MLIKEVFEILFAQGWPYGPGICYIYIVQYIIHTLLQECLWGPRVFEGFTTRQVSMFWPPQWQLQSLAYSFSMCYSFAQWNGGSAAPVSLADDIG